MLSRMSRIFAEAKSEVPVAPDKIKSIYYNFRLKALAACFIGYAAYYVARYNFTLSTPYLKESLGLSATNVGILSNILVITYGFSKGYMGVLSDKAHPKYFMALGLFACSMINFGMAFSSTLWAFAILIALNGVFQGMGAAPAYVTVTKWFPKRQRGLAGAIWNISQNFGGGLVAPIVAVGLIWFGSANWQIACYVLPAATALVVVAVVLTLGKGSPVSEGLPPLNEIYGSEADPSVQLKADEKSPDDLTAWQIFVRYVLPNRNAWYTSFIDVFVYVVRFGMYSWMPLYIIHSKGFTKAEMSTVFLVFEWAAIPSTLAAGWISDRYFRGYRMPPAIIASLVVLVSVFGYWLGTSLTVITISAGIIGCLLYVTQLMANVQCMEIVPPFAVGSLVGLRGFLSYMIGATIGTSLFGIMVDRVGWDGGIAIIFFGVIGMVVFSILSHREIKKAERQRLG